MALARIAPSIKSGEETFSNQGHNISLTLLQFWQWSSSDLLSNATRGILAEFIVAAALGIDITQPRHEWDPFDLITADGISVEVKSAAYIQSWHQKTFSRISFSIRPSLAWEAATNLFASEKKRQAQLYVFCLLHHQDQATINPLQLEQWTFYVVPTKILDEKMPNAKSINLKRLGQLACAFTYADLNQTIMLASGHS